MKLEFTKDGATKLVDPDNQEVIQVLLADGWQTESDVPARRGRPKKVEE
jgi:hypothetical protein